MIALVAFSHLLEPEEKHLQERRPSWQALKGQLHHFTLFVRKSSRAAAVKLLIAADRLTSMDKGDLWP